MPDLSLEATLGGRVAGIDEVGRGPLAGPVVAAAVVIDPARFDPALGLLIDDSKRLNDRKRRALAVALRQDPGISVGLGAACVAEIDRLNILQAALLAMTRAVAALPFVPDQAVVDGVHLPALPCPGHAVVGGDGRVLSVAAASIVAKVLRDDLMAALARRYPGYAWEKNAGYGTRAHREALIRLGATPHHRRSFAPVRAVLNDPR
ncbi:ribonuclease HII [Pararhodospirillum oryzae]|uniref:Ribonuclease HII n=1 Tax=Pararhodospirillum oryzae TaxID=478448 RepID=A0A512HA98_9PROT|nr:ribonuclease HII [Pararhodospirillum oryzae]GEO82383.1 ribonuclease HII [Pararhodospirillum oryzae]